MAAFLYNVILFPLVQIIEFVYLLVYGIFHDFSQPEGFAIIGVSVAITLLCLPLYVVAEKWQQVERDTQKKLEPGISRIKAVFKGDEQYMILRTFYRQNGYHPMMALRSSFGLLIQIPFFMAAYKFLSNLETLRGVSFLFIKDLGVQDATFYIGNFPVNVLPIAMTLINCISGAIYTKGFKAKDKIQVYGMAAIFLVILYSSPSGLVLYWTMNNVFSMVKNIFYKMKKPLLVLFICACVCVLGIDSYLLFIHSGFFFKRLAVVGVFSVVFFIPLLLKLVKYLLDKPFRNLVENKKETFWLFITSALVLLFVFGLHIITSVVAASPMEFSFIDNVESPFTYIKLNFQKILGFCVVWPICIYFLFGKKVKTCIAVLFSFMALGVLINVFAFAGDYGNLSQTLIFDNPGTLRTSMKLNVLNLFVVLAVVIICSVFLGIKKAKWISVLFSFVSVGVLMTSFVSFGKIKSGYNDYAEIRALSGEKKSLNPVFHLSKTEPNVFIISLDRGMGAMVPYVFEERPELYKKFSGFTFYPNTVTFGVNTIGGAPGMYGGYEYVPQEMQRRNSEALIDKHNESLKVMPVLFNNNGFKVTVSDVSFANYMWIPDMRIFNDYPEINALNCSRVYSSYWLSEHPGIAEENATSKLIKINSFWYSFLRISPMILREVIYNQEKYWNTERSENTLNNFIEQYSVLDYLPELTDFTSDTKTYTFWQNETTHEPYFLQAPDYIPVHEVSDRGKGKYSNDETYHVNISSLLRVSEFFDYLKENGVYDNTRIIIVSDHGSDRPTEKFWDLPERYMSRPEYIMPYLFVKDFGAEGDMTFDYKFMTNADVPSLSVEGLIEDPKNPFTGKSLLDTKKENGIYGAQLMHWTPDGQNGNTFNVENWYKTTTNIFEEDSVTFVTEKQAMEALK
ncbi:MAG: membrane protein insertase YidC [Treponema sp.]|nr:membrane protein insertase YidC [Treponema sp.]